MNSVSFFAKVLKRMDHHKLREYVRDIAEKTGKSRVLVFVDMLYCGIRYQAGYHDYREFGFYEMSAKQRATFLTRGINNEIVKKYNDPSYFHFFEDKGEMNQTFSAFLKRDWLDLRSSTEQQFFAFAEKHDRLVAKPFNGEGGKGIGFYATDENTDKAALYRELLEKKQEIVEERLVQHPALKALYPESINTIRMFTFTDGKEAWYLQSLLKIGNGGSHVDNFSSGGMYAFTNEEGVLITPAVDEADHVFEKHPQTGVQIPGFQIPYMKEAVDLAKEAALVVPQIGYVGWDIAITPDGPALIEGNAYPGVFQAKACYSPDGNGILPVYRKIMKF